MKPDDLDSKTPEELDETFAVEVMEWPPADTRGMTSVDGIEWKPCVVGHGFVHVMPNQAPPVSTSADVILPWLEKHYWVRNLWGQVVIHRNTSMSVDAVLATAIAPTFPLAATKALIRAYRTQRGSA